MFQLCVSALIKESNQKALCIIQTPNFYKDVYVQRTYYVYDCFHLLTPELVLIGSCALILLLSQIPSSIFLELQRYIVLHPCLSLPHVFGTSKSHFQQMYVVQASWLDHNAVLPEPQHIYDKLHLHLQLYLNLSLDRLFHMCILDSCSGIRLVELLSVLLLC